MQFNDNQPIWLQIYDHACRAIVSGRWPERERIPSIRELAVTLQVNPNTVMRAYDKLGSDGLILIRRGMGFFVAEGLRRLGHSKPSDTNSFGSTAHHVARMTTGH